MTPQEKQEFNLNCSKFVGVFDKEDYRFNFDVKLYNTYTHQYQKRHHKDKLCFDSEWEWIMLVVETIESIYDDFHGYFGVFINSNGCTIQGTKLRTNPDNPVYAYYDEHICRTKKIATIQAISQFFKFYEAYVK